MTERKRFQDMTDREILQAMQGPGPMAKARSELSSAIGRMEQAGQQRQPQSIFEMRRMEFESLERILGAFATPALEGGTRLPDGPERSARETIADHLPEIAQEILDWRSTGRLPQGHLAAAAATVEGMFPHDAVSIVEQ